MKPNSCPYEDNFIFQDKLKELGLSISFITPDKYVEISKLIKDLAKYKDCEIEIKEILILKILKK